MEFPTILILLLGLLALLLANCGTLDLSRLVVGVLGVHGGGILASISFPGSLASETAFLGVTLQPRPRVTLVLALAHVFCLGLVEGV